MTVASENSRSGPYVADGTQTEFPISFRVLEASHVAVWVDDLRVTEGFSIMLTGNGGTVTFVVPPAEGSRIAIIRDVPFTQETDIQNNAAFLPEVIEDSLDKLTMQTQQLREAVGRCIQAGVNANNPNEVLEYIYRAANDAAEHAGEAAESANDAAESAGEAAESEQYAKNAVEDLAKELARLRTIAGRQVFEVFYSLSSEVPAGAMDLSLGTLISSCDTVFPDFWAEAVKRKSAGSIPVLTEDEWQAAVAANGSCGAFVVDENAKSVRLPKIVHILQPGEEGKFTPAGLPNIKGSINTLKYDLFFTGPFFNGGWTSNDVPRGGTMEYGNVGFDASRSNSIYGNSDTVQPPTIGAKLYIQVFNAAVPASVAQAAEFVNLLAGYLPLAGGEMTGNIYVPHGGGIRTKHGKDIFLLAGPEWRGSARIILRGQESDVNPGCVEIVACGSDGDKTLKLSAEGGLTLNNRGVEVVDSIGDNYIRLSSGLQICFGQNAGNNVITLPKPFVTYNYQISLTDVGQDCHSGGAGNRTTTTFKIFGGSSVHFYWIAIGKWK